MRLDCSEWQAGNLGRIAVTMTQRQAQHGTGAAFRRQAIHGARNIQTCAMIVVSGLIGLGISGSQIAAALVTTMTIEKLTIGEAQQPASHVSDRRNRLAGPKGGKKGFLRQLVGEGTVPGQPAQECPHCTLVSADNSVERLSMM